MMGFFFDVLEVESVDVRKDRNGQSFRFARLRLAGGVLSVRVRDSVKIDSGWCGKASGSARPIITKREYQGHFTDVVSIQPVELDTWVPLQQVQQATVSALESFTGRK